MTNSFDNSVKKVRTPSSSYALMVVAGLGLAAAIGAGAGALRGTGGWWLNFGVFAFVAAAPCLSLGWMMFVAPSTVRPDTHAEDSIETRWGEQATSGAFLDLITGAGILLTAVAVLDIEISGFAVLFGMLVLGQLDVGARYLMAKRQGV